MIKAFTAVSLILISLSLFSLQIQGQSNPTCKGAIMDAGSTGTRIYIYKYPCRTLQTIPLLSNDFAQYQKKVPISSYATHTDDLHDYFLDLIDFAKKQVPDEEDKTPIMFFATAGMRLLTIDKQQSILKVVKEVLKSSGFYFMDEWAQVISGEQEGAWMWLSVNYQLGRLQADRITSANTIGTIDLGGASTQYAYMPNHLTPEENTENDIDITLPYYNWYHLYAHSYLGYGNDQANYGVNSQFFPKDDPTAKEFTSPCYLDGYKGAYINANNTQDQNYDVVGSGNVKACLDTINKYINGDDCKFTKQKNSCGINGTYQSQIPNNTQLYAINGINKVASFFKLPVDTGYTPKQLLQVSTEFCNKKWNENDYDEKIRPYAPTYCFMGLYSAQLLTKGYKIDENKVLTSPDKINKFDVTWTVGGYILTLSQFNCDHDSPVCMSFVENRLRILKGSDAQ